MKNTYLSIVVFGTSITRGSFDGEKGSWVSRLSAYLDAKVPPERGTDIVDVYNLGISGDTSEGVRERFTRELAVRATDAGYDGVTVIFEVGGNDAVLNVKDNTHWVEVPEFIKNVESCVEEALHKGYRVVVLGLHKPDEARTDPIPWDTEHAYRWSECKPYDDALKEMCSRRAVLYIPMQDVYGPQQQLDGDHPNAEGHRLMFERMKEYLEKHEIL